MIGLVETGWTSRLRCSLFEEPAKPQIAEEHLESPCNNGQGSFATLMSESTTEITVTNRCGFLSQMHPFASQTERGILYSVHRKSQKRGHRSDPPGERERERERYVYIHIYTYIHTYTYKESELAKSVLSLSDR